MTTISKFHQALPRVSLLLPLSSQDQASIFRIMVKPYPIPDLKVFQYFVHEQRNKLNFMLEIFKMCLQYDEINTQYRIDLIKMIFLFQQVIALIADCQYPPLSLSPELMAQIKSSPKINDFILSVQQENTSI